MSEIRFYVWQGEDIQANVSAQYTTGSGGRAIGSVGQLPIKNGDVVSIEYGANRQVYTRSGKGYENEYKHGIMSRFGDGASVELDSSTAVFVKSEKASKDVFDSLVQKQKEASARAIADLVIKHETDVKTKYELDTMQREKNEIQRKEKISTALEKMNTFFAPKKPKI